MLLEKGDRARILGEPAKSKEYFTKAREIMENYN
jgi:hypothetical protein